MHVPACIVYSWQQCGKKRIGALYLSMMSPSGWVVNCSAAWLQMLLQFSFPKLEMCSLSEQNNAGRHIGTRASSTGLLPLANFKIGGMAPFLRALFQLVALGAVSNVLCYDSRKSCHLLADWLLLNPNYNKSVVMLF